MTFSGRRPIRPLPSTNGCASFPRPALRLGDAFGSDLPMHAPCLGRPWRDGPPKWGGRTSGAVRRREAPDDSRPKLGAHARAELPDDGFFRCALTFRRDCRQYPALCPLLGLRSACVARSTCASKQGGREPRQRSAHGSDPVGLFWIVRKPRSNSSGVDFIRSRLSGVGSSSSH